MKKISMFTAAAFGFFTFVFIFSKVNHDIAVAQELNATENIMENSNSTINADTNTLVNTENPVNPVANVPNTTGIVRNTTVVNPAVPTTVNNPGPGPNVTAAGPMGSGINNGLTSATGVSGNARAGSAASANSGSSGSTGSSGSSNR